MKNFGGSFLAPDYYLIKDYNNIYMDFKKTGVARTIKKYFTREPYVRPDLIKNHKPAHARNKGYSALSSCVSPHNDTRSLLFYNTLKDGNITSPHNENFEKTLKNLTSNITQREIKSYNSTLRENKEYTLKNSKLENNISDNKENLSIYINAGMSSRKKKPCKLDSFKYHNNYSTRNINVEFNWKKEEELNEKKKEEIKKLLCCNEYDIIEQIIKKSNVRRKNKRNISYLEEDKRIFNLKRKKIGINFTTNLDNVDSQKGNSNLIDNLKVHSKSKSNIFNREVTNSTCDSHLYEASCMSIPQRFYTNLNNLKFRNNNIKSLPFFNLDKNATIKQLKKYKVLI